MYYYPPPAENVTTTTTTYYYAAPPPQVQTTQTTQYYQQQGMVPPHQPASYNATQTNAYYQPPTPAYQPQPVDATSYSRQQDSYSQFSGIPSSFQNQPNAYSEFNGLPPSSTQSFNDDVQFQGLPPSHSQNFETQHHSSEFQGLPQHLSGPTSYEQYAQQPYQPQPVPAQQLPQPVPQVAMQYQQQPPVPQSAIRKEEYNQPQPLQHQNEVNANVFSIAEEPLDPSKARNMNDAEFKGIVHAIVGFINQRMRQDPQYGRHLPMNPLSEDLFKFTADGILFNKLINVLIPDTVDERTLNQGENLNLRQKEENVHLALNSARGLGCDVSHIRVREILTGNNKHSASLLWAIIKMGALSRISPRIHPGLNQLLLPGETPDMLSRLSPSEILVRWINYQLSMAGVGKRIGNLSRDVADSEAYIYLLNHLAPSVISDLSGLQSPDFQSRASNVIQNSQKIGCGNCIQVIDIVQGNEELNTFFVAELFNYSPNLGTASTIPSPIIPSSTPEREIQAFEKWMSSLGINIGTFNKNTLSDGSVLLKIIDKLVPGSVNWGKVQYGQGGHSSATKFQQIEACNYALELCKSMGVSSVNISGPDIQGGNEKLGLALIWQLMRYHLLHFTKNSSFTEDQIISWVNQKVSSTGRTISIKDFNDKTLSNSHFILDLLTACRPGSVDYTQITMGKTPEQQLKNAKYAISCARKLGCPSIFLLPEDIVEVNGKLVMTLFASIMQVYGPR